MCIGYVVDTRARYISIENRKPVKGVCAYGNSKGNPERAVSGSI